MAEKGKQGSTDVTSTAQARFTVQLPSEVRDDLELISQTVSEAVRATTGVGVELSMAQTVTALIKARAGEIRWDMERAAAEAESNGAGAEA